MSPLIKALLTIQLIYFSLPGVAADVSAGNSSEQRVIFETKYGNLVFSLFPDIAPLHVAQFTRLVETGAYDTTHFFRLMPGFVLQLSDIYDRKKPLTAEQGAANQRIPAEFSTQLKHRAAVLSMARETNDPGSATSSFSILLGNAPHLDGQYTIFGELESGDSVLKKMLAVPRIEQTPSQRLSVNRAYIINNLSVYYEKFPLDPVDKGGSIVATKEILDSLVIATNDRTRLIVIMLTAVVVIGVAGFFMYERISKARLLSLLLIDVLISVFLLFILLTPEGHKNSWLAVLIFIGLFSTFRLMSYFESKRD